MKWVKDLVHRFFKWMFSLWVKFNSKNGLSFNPDISISNMAAPMPALHTFYELAHDTAAFEVMHVDIKDSCVTIREVGTDIEYKIDAELFIILFVLKEPDTSFDLF